MAEHDTGTEATGIASEDFQYTFSGKHPAKYGNNIMNKITRKVQQIVESTGLGEWDVLDPFGGVGGIFDLHRLSFDYDAGDLDFKITCIEIEPEWADMAFNHPHRRSHDQVLIGDAMMLMNHPSMFKAFDLVIVSPTYGNRMADNHTPSPEDTSTRNTYRHTLGRPLSQGSSASMQWGAEYRAFHESAWQKVWHCLRPGGWFLLNVKDHIRAGEKQPVSVWHKNICTHMNFQLVDTLNVQVGGLRQGANHEARVDAEQVYVFRRPVPSEIGELP